jgi:hypothetical protein
MPSFCSIPAALNCAERSRSILPLTWLVGEFHDGVIKVMFKSKLSVSLLMVAMSLAACAAPPQQLMDQASQAREEAKAAGAEMYASQSMQTAEAAYAAAEEQIAAEGKKFAASRNYKMATDKFNEAIAAYNQAKTDAMAAKDTMKGEVETMAKLATAEVDDVEQMLAKTTASRPKMDVTEWQNEVAKLRQALSDASQAQGQEDYPTAKQKLQSVMDRATELKAAMQSTRA